MIKAMEDMGGPGGNAGPWATFEPAYAHPFYGENEVILGYQGLVLKVRGWTCLGGREVEQLMQGGW